MQLIGAAYCVASFNVVLPFATFLRRAQTARIKYKNMTKVVKTFVKHDASVDLNQYKAEIERVRDITARNPNAQPYQARCMHSTTCLRHRGQAVSESARAGFIVRPYLHRLAMPQLIASFTDCHAAISTTG